MSANDKSIICKSLNTCEKPTLVSQLQKFVLLSNGIAFKSLLSFHNLRKPKILFSKNHAVFDPILRREIKSLWVFASQRKAKRTIFIMLVSRTRIRYNGLVGNETCSTFCSMSAQQNFTNRRSVRVEPLNRLHRLLSYIVQVPLFLL